MLANTRPNFLFALCLAYLAVACLPIAAQGQGSATVASHTSAPSAAKPSPFSARSQQSAAHSAAASSRPNASIELPALGCCSNFYLPSSFTPLVSAPLPIAPEHRRHLRNDGAVWIPIPVYIPYAIGYEPDSSDTAPDEADVQYAYSADDPYPGRPKRAAAQRLTTPMPHRGIRRLPMAGCLTTRTQRPTFPRSNRNPLPRNPRPYSSTRMVTASAFSITLSWTMRCLSSSKSTPAKSR